VQSTLVAQVDKGVAARWAQKKDEEGGSGGSKGDGIIEWVCSDVKSGTTLDLELGYEVAAPHDWEWN